MQEFIAARRDEIAELCRTYHVRRFSVFGSAVRDDFVAETSDVDVRIEFDENADRSALDYFDLHDRLVALFGREVDLISAKTISNRYLRREIEETQVTLYAA